MHKNEEIVKVLESIGLSKNETEIYLDLLINGKSSANDISKRTSIHRTNVYDILENLSRKGIADKIIENEKNFYYPSPPKELLDSLKQTQDEFEKILPQLESIQNQKVEERKVYVSEGLTSVKNILMDLLAENQPIYIYGMPKEVMGLLGNFIDDFHTQRISKGIIFKGIYNQSAMKRIKELNCMALTEARYFPSTYDSKISTTICGNKVILQFWDLPTSAVVIENDSIAKSYKNFFDILWNEAIALNNVLETME